MSKRSDLQKEIENPKKKIIDILESFRYKRGVREAFRALVEISALELFSACPVYDKELADTRHKRLESVKSQFTDEELKKLYEAQKIMASYILENQKDILGEIFMELSMGNDAQGQFFTPEPICKLMALMMMQGEAEKAKEFIKEKGYYMVSDPCVGAGGMLLAAAQVLKKQGIDVRNEVLFYASDVDMTAVYMAYTQMSLMRMPAVLRRMDALSQKGDKDLWITLGVFVSQNLSHRLFRQKEKEAVEENPNPIER